jgi:outer membrane protein
MKARALIVSIVATLMVSPLVAVAQSAGVVKIGVVDLGRLIQESPQGQAAREVLEDEFAPRRRELVAMQTDMQEKGAALQKDLEVMGAAERENAQRELSNDEREFVRSQNEFREDIELRQGELLGKVQQELGLAIREYAAEKSFDIVLYEGIIHASNRVLITDAIIERMSAPAAEGAAE